MEEEKTILAALHDRYGDDEPLMFEICVPKSAPGKTESGKLVLPRVLGLEALGLSEVGDTAEMSDICSRITEIDLTGNAFRQWSEVLTLLRVMPRLEFLNLCDNPLQAGDILTDRSDTQTEGDTNHTHPLSKLVLNGMTIAWSTLWALLERLPCIEELHLSRNSIEQVELPQQEVTYPKVKVVHMRANQLADWTEICKLGRIFPNLENLVLGENPITSLPSSADALVDVFSSLCRLNLTDCPIDSWASLETLRHLPKLSDLRIRGIPLVQEYSEELRRQLTMAYLPNITQLNGGVVHDSEREDAERAFIRHYMDSDNKPNSTQMNPAAAVMRQLPLLSPKDRTRLAGPMNIDNKPNRYSELHAVYGDLDPLASVTLKAPTSIHVTIHCQGKSTIQTLDPKWTLRQVKQHLFQKNVIPQPVFWVYHEDVGAPHGQEYMRFEEKSLYMYKVKDGDGLHVELERHKVHSEFSRPKIKIKKDFTVSKR